MDTPLKYADLTRKIIGRAMEIHRSLGSGFPEIIYHRAMALEFRLVSMKFEHEPILPVIYKGEPIGTLRADFVVDNIVLVELKAVMNLEDSHFAQSLNYLEAFNIETGLLLNFGGPSLEFKRLFNKKFNPQE